MQPYFCISAIPEDLVLAMPTRGCSLADARGNHARDNMKSIGRPLCKNTIESFCLANNASGAPAEFPRTERSSVLYLGSEFAHNKLSRKESVEIE